MIIENVKFRVRLQLFFRFINPTLSVLFVPSFYHPHLSIKIIHFVLKMIILWKKKKFNNCFQCNVIYYYILFWVIFYWKKITFCCNNMFTLLSRQTVIKHPFFTLIVRLHGVPILEAIPTYMDEITIVWLLNHLKTHTFFKFHHPIVMNKFPFQFQKYIPRKLTCLLLSKRSFFTICDNNNKSFVLFFHCRF